MPDFDHERDAARADLCRLLSACYYQPGPEFVEEKLFDSMRAAAEKIEPDLAARADRLGKAFAAEYEDLLLDYTRLYLGPTQIIAKPYGSVWLTGETTVMQDSTMAVLDLYKQGGFEIDEEFRELPDHVAAELEFLYLLIFREIQARLNSEAPEAGRMAELRRRLIDEHLGRWIEPFTAAVRGGAQSNFYRELAALTARFIEMEQVADRAALH